MRFNKTLLAPVAFCLIGISACAPTSQLQLSSGCIGCSTADVVIGDVNSSGKSESWSATCRGQTYYCSATSEFREVICHPQIKAVVAPPAPPAAPLVPPAVDISKPAQALGVAAATTAAEATPPPTAETSK